MAVMKKFSLDKIRENSSVTVGNNRTIAVNDGVFCGFLHGNEIFQVELDENDPHAALVCLDHCGYMTSTTIRAMNDFLEYFGLRAKASIKKGNLVVKHTAVNYHDYTIDDAPRNVTFHCARNPNI